MPLLGFTVVSVGVPPWAMKPPVDVTDWPSRLVTVTSCGPTTVERLGLAKLIVVPVIVTVPTDTPPTVTVAPA